jgi:hypothetical protein
MSFFSGQTSGLKGPMRRSPGGLLPGGGIWTSDAGTPESKMERMTKNPAIEKTKKKISPWMRNFSQRRRDHAEKLLGNI